MTNYVDHKLTITGPEMELERFANCFVTAKEGDLFTRYFIDEYFDSRPLERPVGALYFNFCMIKVAPGEINLAWLSGYDPALEVYEELAELFPRLTMEGDYCEHEGFCIAGDVRCHGGKFTHVDKSKELEAKMAAWEVEHAAK